MFLKYLNKPCDASPDTVVRGKEPSNLLSATLFDFASY